MMTAQRVPFSLARNRTFNAAAVALLFLFLWWADGSMALDLGLSFLPEPLNGYEVQILNLVAVYGILAISLNIIYGFTGMFSLGHAGFMAIGAYVFRPVRAHAPTRRK